MRIEKARFRAFASVNQTGTWEFQKGGQLLKQEKKILNEPAAIYWFNEILFVILSGLKNGLTGL